VFGVRPLLVCFGLAGALPLVELHLSAQPPASAASSGTIIVGVQSTDNTSISTELTDSVDSYEGDLVRAVARAQGLQVKFKVAPLSELWTDLDARRIDLIPSLARTPERATRYDLSVPHTNVHTGLFVRRGDHQVNTTADLPGRSIIVVNGSFSVEWCEKHGFGAQLIRERDVPAAVQALSSGRGDCLLTTQDKALEAMRHLGINNILLRQPAEPGLQKEHCMVVRRGDRELLAKLNEGLFVLKQTGELDKIYEKWRGVLAPDNPFARFKRPIALASVVLLLLAVAAWLAHRLQVRRALARLQEIERRVAERTDELAAEKARFQAVVQNTPAAVMLIDPHAAKPCIIECNEPACQLHGYSREELVGAPFELLEPNDAPGHHVARVLAELNQKPNTRGQTRLRRKDGRVFDVEFHATRLRLGGRELLLGIHLDITDRVRAEAALRRTEEFQRLVLRATNDGIFDYDASSNLFELSARGWQMLGFGPHERPPTHEGWWERLHPDDRAAADAAWQRHRASGAPYVHTARFVHKDGSTRWLYCRADTLKDASGRPIRMVGSYTDITDVKRIDEELQLSRRLRALGELVGGIAHEFNNLLTPILLEGSLLQESASRGTESGARSRTIVDAARRAQALTQRLLQLGRRRDAGIETQKVATIVENTLALVRTTFDRRITLTAQLDGNLPALQVNITTIGQAVMNLVINARDTLLEKLGGNPPPAWRPQITLALTRQQAPARGSTGQPAGPVRWWQQLSVSDNGMGLESDVRTRMFEPFFTTKALGQGTGLGLAMVWAAAAEAGGWIEVESTVGEGSTFYLYLPDAAEAISAIEPESTPVQVRPKAARAARRRLLFVDDDPLVGASTTRLLTHFGHEVSWLRSGDEARPHFSDGGTTWDAMITDLNMPGLGGEELAAHARRSGYRGKIVVISGQILMQTEARLRAAGVDVVVAKPFDVHRLRAVLDGLWENPDTAASI
jgi:two-component system, cell cycle sensor histidine kinase and response regulator CckA